MARALHRPLARLFHRTVPALAVRGFGGALVVAGVALPWVVAVAGGWVAAAEEPPVLAEAERPEVEPTPTPLPTPGEEPVSGTLVAAATGMRPALVYVAGGTFLMGSPSGEVGRYDEDETQHRVQVGWSPRSRSTRIVSSCAARVRASTGVVRPPAATVACNVASMSRSRPCPNCGSRASSVAAASIAVTAKGGKTGTM